MAQSGKPLHPQLDQHNTKELNLTVLQRMDRYVEDILTTAGHVTLFQFDTVTQQWIRKDVEGSLFVVKRRSQPRFQFIVMNRQSTDNLVENLLGDFEYEVQAPNLLYRNANQETNYILFTNKRECEEVDSLFQRILNAFSKPPSKPRLIPASSDYVELEAAPTSVNFEGPLERGPIASSTMLEMQDEPLERRLNTVRTSTPDIVPSTATRPPINHSVQSRTSVPASPTLAPMPLSSILSSTTASPLNSLAPPLPLDTPDNPSAGRATLIKPSFFVPPFSSVHSTPSAPLIPSSTPVVPSHGAPLLQPYPPPNPPHSLSPAMQQGVPVTRDGVRDALNRLVKNEHFIEMVYREMNTHSFRYG
ncbi:mRNA-decapping enzyme-like protein [Physcomitrium patens]|uniref:mRNA-decapping enzyme-like protein n=1 Tax=Physcomitrium patens TaxID=3218 RepID=A0A2K1J8V1_PHYPA|nr:mRNA-decapping enzyme-like protein [Physcomitrium patens]PNR37954.1 hypothetical protein PHYPA_021064 [Physcomitrium patens]|eukprot:XP_024397741.1 mRNA-decapping enzyme-like protein [Physcomitrella patens]